MRASSVVRRWVVRILVAAVVLVVMVAAAAALLAVTAPSPRPAAGWSRGAGLPEARGETAGAVVTIEGREQLAVIGGLKGLFVTASDTVELYDPASRRWRQRPPLPEPRHHLAAAGIGGTLFAAGGASSPSDWTPRREVWRLQQGARTWEPLPPLPEGRHGHRLMIVDNVLYVIGGSGGAAVLRLNPDAPHEGWSRRSDLPHPRNHLGAVAVDGEIWVIGGRDGGGIVDRVDIYDPRLDRWRMGPALPAPTSGAAVGFVEGWIVISGGEDPRLLGGVIDRHWRIRPGGTRWEPAPRSPLSVHGAADGVVGGRLLVAGGAARHGVLSPLAWTGVTQSLDEPGKATWDG